MVPAWRFHLHLAKTPPHPPASIYLHRRSPLSPSLIPGFRFLDLLTPYRRHSPLLSLRLLRLLPGIDVRLLGKVRRIHLVSALALKTTFQRLDADINYRVGE